MAQASQQLPSWLTLSSTLITEPDGSLSTSFATLRLPLTYYGPSIPLGTDGVWTYGGLTPPPTNSPTPTTSPTPSPTVTGVSSSTPSSSQSPSSQSPSSQSPSSRSTSILSSISPISSSASPSSSSALGAPAPTTSSSPVASASHGISTAVLGAVLGSIIGLMLLIILILTLCFIRRQTGRRRSSNPEAGNTNTSSFWNRQTSLFTVPWHRDDGGDGNRRSTPIWTGYEFINPEGTEGNGRGRNGAHEPTAVAHDDSHTPGDGSPRGSGEEADPFLTRRSLRDAALHDEKAQTNVPAAIAKVGSGSVRASPPRGGHIIPRDVQRRIAEEDASSPYSIRIVEATPHQDYSPLLPPPPLNVDRLGGLTAGPSRRPSDKSLDSQRTKDRSLHSEKSMGSLDADPAEFLIARRVRVGELGQTHTRLPTIESETGESGGARSSLGLTGLTGRLGRLSWFRRLSSSAAETQDFTIDPYTRTPPRSSRQGSNSRPGSWARLPDNPDASNNPSRRSHNDNGLGFGLLSGASRPISSVSARSQTTTSGNTVYFDTRSRPASPGTPAVPPLPQFDFPMPVTSPIEQERLARSGVGSPVGESYYDEPTNPPPAYDATSMPRPRSSPLSQEADILDTPVPIPTSAFSSRPVPPGLHPLPCPRAWRDSHVADDLSTAGSRDSAGININIEDDPPVAQESWRDLASERDGRRRTFGTVRAFREANSFTDNAQQPAVIEPFAAFNSQHPSVHSLHSHLRPEGDHSGSHSDPTSNHSQGGSHSSRPSGHSQLLSVGSDPSYGSRSEEGSSDEVGALRSPPLSAVRGSFGSSRPPSRQGARSASRSNDAYITPASSRAPLLGGTVTSSTTTGTNTNSSVTTALTDPITGAVLHFPSLPWGRGQETVRRVESWHDTHDNDDDPW
ncbi:hypothetical protein BDW22DRAFT_1405201 [Trametopsis cervina]|nr:hypothetical protein BDW22DRAFT_1405201 [Trametopsis cervina]